MNRDNLENESDEKLIEIVNYPLAYDEPLKIKARAVLHKRQKKLDLSARAIGLWTLIFTILIFILTLYLVYSEIEKRKSTPISESKNPVVSQPSTKNHAPAKKSSPQKNIN